jgi:hypothetical protein
MSETANLALPFIAAAQAQKHVTHNEALLKLDALVQLAVLTRGFSAPPADPEEGARYLIAAPASGDWSGHENSIAACQDGAWNIFAPNPGWRLWIADEERLLVFTNGAWAALDPDITETSKLGISATADDYNRLVVSAPASLFTHSGGGHQLKINKAESVETASLLFQTNWSGRAEMGTAGDDRFRIKVSADGGSWREALTVDGTSGRVSFPAGIGLGSTQIGLAPASSLRMTGLADGEPSSLVVLTNETSGGEGALILLEHQSPDAEATDRFAFADGMPCLLMPGDSIALLYAAEASAWSELASRRFGQGFDVFSDAFVLSNLALLASGTGAGASAGDWLLSDAVHKPRGIIRLGTGSSAAGRSHWGSGGRAILAGQGACLHLVRLAVEALSSDAERFRIIAGWHDGQETGEVSNGVFWDYDESVSPYWRLCVADGGLIAATLSNRLVATEYIWLGIFLNAGCTRADFFSSADGGTWTFHDSLASGLPSAAQTLGFSAGIAKASGEAERCLSIDLQAMRCDGSRGH